MEQGSSFMTKNHFRGTFLPPKKIILKRGERDNLHRWVETRPKMVFGHEPSNAAKNQKAYRIRQKAGFRVAPVSYNWQILDVLVRARALTEAEADSGNSRLIGQRLSEWLLRSALR
jgi:hypothetical protein